MRIDSIKKALDDKYGDDWVGYEIETILHDCNIPLTPIHIDMIGMLKTLEKYKGVFLHDVRLFLYFVETSNYCSIDFETIPEPTVLEVCLAVLFLKSMYPTFTDYDNSIKETVTYLLIEDGYSKPPAILSGICFPEKLHKGQTEEDISAKEEALKLYIKEVMNNVPF